MKKKYKQYLIVFGVVLLAIVVAMVFLVQKANAPTSLSKTSPILKPTKSTASFDKHKYSLTNSSSLWVIANKQNPLKPTNYTPADLVSVGNGQLMRSAAAKSLLTMFTAASWQGLPMKAASGYRSYQTQVAVYASEVKNNGQGIADSESARPGYSEHQTGLAVDISGGGCIIQDCFGQTEQGQWIVTNAYKYGFILRYPIGKQAITGYRYEPWHIRYVGVDLATEMHKQKIETLEEFFNLPAAANY